MEPRAYCSETAAGELEPRETGHLHLLSTLLTHYVAADKTKATTFHSHKLGHTTGGLTTDNIWGATLMRGESGPPAADKDLRVLRVKCGLEPRLEKWGIMISKR